MDDIAAIDLKSYSPSSKTKHLLEDVPVLLLVGPTASGKDTVARELLKTGRFHNLVTHTTRPPRYNHGVLEISGHDYHFINLIAARNMLDTKDFVEAAIIHGNLYGTSVEEFEKARQGSKIAVAAIDVQGVRSYKRLSKKAIAVFLLPPSFEILRSRLAKRYGHSHHDQDIKVRLTTALHELDELLKTDYYYAVVNSGLNQTLKTIEQILETNHYAKKQDQQSRKLAKTLISDIKTYLEG